MESCVQTLTVVQTMCGCPISDYRLLLLNEDLLLALIGDVMTRWPLWRWDFRVWCLRELSCMSVHASPLLEVMTRLRWRGWMPDREEWTMLSDDAPDFCRALRRCT